MSDEIRRRTWRRRLGVLCIAAAILMLILGETLLRTILAHNPVLLLIYWMTCFILTALAAGFAIIDAARVRLESREQQRSLLEETLQEVEREKRERKKSEP
jgi:ABC-type bacteriocin/lantibiotic exporter with double-glycine peptidase domain